MKIKGFTFFGLGGLLQLVATTAVGQTNSSKSVITSSNFIDFIYIALALLSLLISVFIYFTNKKITSKAKKFKKLAHFTQSLLLSSESEFITLHDDNRCFCSLNLSKKLGLDEQNTNIETLQNLMVGKGFEDPEVIKLYNRLKAVKKSGAPIEFELKNPTTKTVFFLRGEKLKNLPENTNTYVLWVTEKSETEKTLIPQIRSLSDEGGSEVLTTILNTLDVPFWIRDKNGTLIWINGAYIKAVEISSRRQVLDDQIELLDQDRAQEARDLREESFNKDQSFSHFKHIVIDGERRFFNIFERYLKNVGGGSIGYALDLTKEELSQNDLQTHKKAHSDTLDRLTTSIAILGPDKSLIYHNQAFRSLFNLLPEKLENDPSYGEVLELLKDQKKLPEQADFLSWKKLVLEGLRNILSPREDMWHLMDGTTIRVITGPHPLGGWLIIHEDVTDKLTLERNYNSLIAVQSQTLNNLHEGVAVIGTDSRIKFLSKNFSSLWGLKELNLKEEPSLENFLDSFRHLLAKDGVDWLDLRAKIIGLSLTRKPEIGKWNLTNGKTLEFAFVPLPDGGANFNIIDVTDSFRIEVALKEKTEALKAADQIKAEFLANMSYELKTPLSSIIGFTELLNEKYFGDLNEKQLDYTNTILESSKALGSLIDNILDIAIIEAGKMELDSSKFEISKAVDKVLSLTNEKVNSKSIKIEVNCNKNTGEIIGDRRRIQHALYNIVTDALNFTPNGGKIIIHTEGRENFVDIKVISSKSSWPSDFILNSNIEYNSLTSINPLGSKGRTGQATLNLSLVKSFIQLHGGKVFISSDLESETIITCTLPRIPIQNTEPSKNIEGPM